MGLHEDALARQRDNEERMRQAGELDALRATPYAFPQVVELAQLCREYGLKPSELFRNVGATHNRSFESTGEFGWIANLHHPVGSKPLPGRHGIAFSEDGHCWAYAVFEKFEGFLSNGRTKGLPRPGAWVVSRPNTYTDQGHIPGLALDVEDAASEVVAGRAVGSMIPMSDYTRSKITPSERN